MKHVGVFVGLVALLFSTVDSADEEHRDVQEAEQPTFRAVTRTAKGLGCPAGYMEYRERKLPDTPSTVTLARDRPLVFRLRRFETSIERPCKTNEELADPADRTR